MTDEQFTDLVNAGLAALPEKVRAIMHNVAVVIGDEISEQQMAEMNYREDEEVFGLYEGIPQTERGVDYQALPDKIIIFKGPILRTYSDPADIRECVANTVWHEVAHHFGYGDPWIKREEGRRGKEK